MVNQRIVVSQSQADLDDNQEDLEITVAETSKNETSPKKRSKSATILSWRSPNETASPSQTTTSVNKIVELSNGIPARSFHRNSSFINSLRQQVHGQVLTREKRLYAQQWAVQRTAFAKLTSLSTFKLQEQAIKLLCELLNEKEKEHASRKITTSTINEQQEQQEPYPIRYQLLLQSPNKSQLQHYYQREFQQSSSSPHAQTALWSLEPRLFSVETSATGKRSYVAGHLGRFQDTYWRLTDPLQRHGYEVLWAQAPCVRLYLDLEYSRTVNASISMEQEELLLTELFAELQLEFQNVHQMTIARSHIVDLDSSTQLKFSRHWIVHAPRLFASTKAVGAFVKQFISRLANEQATGELLEKNRLALHQYLFVNTTTATSTANSATAAHHTQKRACIVDLNVYTRNRLFRLLGSQKFGKPPTAALRIAAANQFAFPRGFDNTCFYLPAMKEHLKIHNNNKSADDGVVDEAVQNFVQAMDWTLHAEALAMTLVVPVDAAALEILPLIETETATAAAPKTTTSSVDRASCTTFGPSPYPYLDDYVETVLAARGDVQGSLRAWSVDRRSDNGMPLQIVYHIHRNRFCECIGRHHKSNGILWKVDFVNYHCTQSCFDADCRAQGFIAGNPVPLPKEIKEELREAMFDEELARLDETTLIPKSTMEQQATYSTAVATIPTLTDNSSQQETSAEAAMTQSSRNQSMAVTSDRTNKQTCFTSSCEESIGSLDDDDLLAAILLNPELFP
jgi:hypothetical protein